MGLQAPTKLRRASPLRWGTSIRNRLVGSSSELGRNSTCWSELRAPRTHGHASDEPDTEEEEEEEEEEVVVIIRRWV